jgi:putative transposase
MITGRPKATVTLVPDEQTKLHSRGASRNLPHALVARAKLMLWSAQRQSNAQIARSRRNTTVGKWRQRFIEHRLAGLYEELRPGQPRRCEDGQIAALLKRTISRKHALDHSAGRPGRRDFPLHRASPVSILCVATPSQPQL